MPIVDDITSQASQFADIEPIIHSAEKSGERSQQTFAKVPSGNSKNLEAGGFQKNVSLR